LIGVEHATTMEKVAVFGNAGAGKSPLARAFGGDNWAVRDDADIERIISALEISQARLCVHRLSDFGVGDAGEIALCVEEISFTGSIKPCGVN
jgi:hypothetical protein